MNDPTSPVGPKTHPATREVLPDDPMQMHGNEVPGDPQLMLQLLVEEYARMGWGVDAVMELAKDPNYQSFHGLYLLFGEEGLCQRVSEIISRCGVFRVKTEEAPTEPTNLVQIDL